MTAVYVFANCAVPADKVFAKYAVTADYVSANCN